MHKYDENADVPAICRPLCALASPVAGPAGTRVRPPSPTASTMPAAAGPGRRVLSAMPADLLPGPWRHRGRALRASARPTGHHRERYALATAAEALPAGTGGWRTCLQALTQTLARLAGFRAISLCPLQRPSRPPPGWSAPGVDAKPACWPWPRANFWRDLINTPASDMGPQPILNRRRDLADRHGAEIQGHRRGRSAGA